ncbi:MAG: LysM peptidoglycan-binding domain-containing protein [Chloroflexi bacterium]|nr:LysM peptidoglycan-binding domain-containing protein [Chloroflexota bacterium]
MSGDSSGAAIRWLILFLSARRSARWLGALVVFAGLAAHASFAPPSIAADTYEVQPGDSASAIAERLGVPTHLLLALNPQIESPNLLFAGQILTVPDGYGLPEGSTLPAAARLVHTVQEGDTLSVIADRYGVSTADLLLLNPGLDPDLIAIGAQIVVLSEGGAPVVTGPAPPLAVDPDPAGVSYRVQPGDTYSAIAARFGLSPAELFALNPTMPPTDVLFVGDSLLVPAAAVPEPPAGDPLQAPRTVYVVQPGDTALALAELYGMTLAELLVLNPGLAPDLLSIGQALIVPDTVPHAAIVGANAGALTVYTIQAGDTLSEIADRGGFSVDSLLAVNPGIDPDLITLGATLFLPVPPPPPISYSTVVVEASDFPEYVAADIGVLPETLFANNPGLDPAGIIVAGTVLTVPDVEGVIVTVQPGDTLAAIAAIQGSTVDAILADPRNVGIDPTALVVGQQIVVPVATPFFVWPTNGEISDYFGVCRWECASRHNGLDLATTAGSDIRAIAGGIVTFSGGSVCCGLGLYVEIDHGNGWISRYGHLAYLGTVVAGQFVAQGEVIGTIGCTGLCTGPHLHLELEHNGWFLDPLNYLS